MSTYDVPGANPDNHDELALGSWAEHNDGSLIFVESTEANRVVYSIFDMAKDPIMEYRDAMPEVSFKSTFTWKPGDDKRAKPNEKWLWHDKTPFPWDRVIKKGFSDGVRPASVEGYQTAAERVAERLRLRGEEFDRGAASHRQERVEQGPDILNVLKDKFARALGEFLR